MKKLATIAPWAILFTLAAVNTLLIKQNLDLRAHAGELERKLDPASWSLQPGEEVQSFSTFDLNGKPYTVDFKKEGRNKIFLFFTPGCAFCGQQIPYWRDLLNNIDSSKFEVVGLVGERDDKQQVLKHIEEAGYLSAKNPLHVVMGSDNVLRSYKLGSTPTTLLVRADGHTEKVWVGRWDVKIASEASTLLGLPPRQ
jgi:peroxiredoxin